MAGAPGLEQVERLGPAHLADRDPVGPKAQGRADQVGERGDAILGAQRNEIGRGALQLARVLDQHHPVAGLGDLGQQGIGQRRLASRGPARNEDVGPCGNRSGKRGGTGRRHDPGRDIVRQAEDRARRLADRKARRSDDRRQKTLEPLARPGQFRRDPRRA